MSKQRVMLRKPEREQRDEPESVSHPSLAQKPPKFAPQAKMTVNTPGDSFEQEADSVADSVMRTPDPSPGSLRRKDEEGLSRKESDPISSGGPDVSGAVSEGLSGGGQSLDSETRSFMEPRFGHDFSQVKIHTDSQASQSAEAVAARAYTVGGDIAFRSGQYEPGTSEGKRLLAHELTHVVQQGAAPAQGNVQRKEVSDAPGGSVQRFFGMPGMAGAQQPDTQTAGAEPATAPKTVDPAQKQNFLNKCGDASAVLQQASMNGRALMLSIANAYGDAWKHHTDALKEQSESSKFFGELILGAALAFFPGKAISEAMKKMGRGDYISDGIADLAKFGSEQGAKFAMKGAGADGMTAFPTDPLQWQNQVDLRMNAEMGVVAGTILDWRLKTESDDPTFHMDFDPAAAVSQSLSLAGQPMVSIQPGDPGQMSLDFERSFWIAWLQNFGYQEVRVGPTNEIIENAGKKIKERCEVVGVDVEKYTLVAQKRLLKKQADEGNFMAKIKLEQLNDDD